MSFFILFLVFIVVVALLQYYESRISSKETFAAYAKKFPNLVGAGKVQCHACGSDSIWLKSERRTAFGTRYAHTCRICGTELYYSKG